MRYGVYPLPPCLLSDIYLGSQHHGEGGVTMYFLIEILHCNVEIKQGKVEPRWQQINVESGIPLSVCNGRRKEVDNLLLPKTWKEEQNLPRSSWNTKPWWRGIYTAQSHFFARNIHCQLQLSLWLLCQQLLKHDSMGLNQKVRSCKKRFGFESLECNKSLMLPISELTKLA